MSDRRPSAAPGDIAPCAAEVSGRQSRQRRMRNAARITVTDDWPEIVPLTDAELLVIESFFADVLDEILGPRA